MRTRYQALSHNGALKDRIQPKPHFLKHIWTSRRKRIHLVSHPSSRFISLCRPLSPKHFLLGKLHNIFTLWGATYLDGLISHFTSLRMLVLLRDRFLQMICKITSQTFIRSRKWKCCCCLLKKLFIFAILVGQKTIRQNNPTQNGGLHSPSSSQQTAEVPQSSHELLNLITFMNCWKQSIYTIKNIYSTSWKHFVTSAVHHLKERE